MTAIEGEADVSWMSRNRREWPGADIVKRHPIHSTLMFAALRRHGRAQRAQMAACGAQSWHWSNFRFGSTPAIRPRAS